MNFIAFFLLIQSQLKVWHWQTKSFAQHKAFDDTYSSLDELIDSFMESYMGRYGRPYTELSIKLENYPEGNFAEKIDKFIVVLEQEFEKELSDTDLLNLRDEMLGVLNKLKYLLTLK